MQMNTHVRRLALLAPGLALVLAGAGVAQTAGETFTATASLKAPTTAKSAPVTIAITRFTTEAERDKVIAAVRNNDHAATRRALETAPEIGYLEVGPKRTPIKYAYARSTGAGRMVTVLTATPVAYVGSEAAGAKPKGQYELAMALLILDDHGAGDGELSPAVTLKVDDKGAISTSDYSQEFIRLTGIAKKK
jgi:hypothetical protein